ncbi:hypothetical protein [Halopelagius inordinatus]|nr:hypothetical protein [Halopelagius inordinatus]
MRPDNYRLPMGKFSKAARIWRRLPRKYKRRITGKARRLARRVTGK